MFLNLQVNLEKLGFDKKHFKKAYSDGKVFEREFEREFDDSELYVYKLDKIENDEIRILDIENDEVRSYKNENDFYLISNENNLFNLYLISNENNFDYENEFNHFFNDQVIHFGEIKDGFFISYETTEEGGFYIVENEKDLKDFKEWCEKRVDWVLDYLEDSKKIKEIKYPFIIKWGI